MIAYLIVSHTNVPQVVRLIDRLLSVPDSVVFLHHDPRSPERFAPSAVRDPSRVRLVPAEPVRWGTIDYVDAMLRGIETAERSGVDYRWMVYLSAQDYPCVDLAAFHRALERAPFDGFVDQHHSLTPAARAENAERYHFRWYRLPRALRPLAAALARWNPLRAAVRFADQRSGAFVGVAAAHAVGGRPYRRGETWWTLSRPCARALLGAAAEPATLAALRRRIHPEEAFAQTVLLADHRFAIADDSLRYIRWDGPVVTSPAVLRIDDLPEILGSHKPFARKFDTRVDARVLDAIDAAVDGGRVAAPVFRAAHRPLVTLGLAVRNAEDRVGGALASMLAQTYEEIEVAVCDDASTDGTAAIVAELARRDRRVRLFRNVRPMNAEANAARLLEVAHGRYFGRASAAVALPPTCVARCVELLEADPSVALVVASPAGRPLFGIGRPEAFAAAAAAEPHAADAALLDRLAPFGTLRRLPEPLALTASDGRPGAVQTEARLSHERCPTSADRQIARAPGSAQGASLTMPVSGGP